MIPTVIIINDGNKKLANLELLLQSFVRTFHRTSLDGEKLYGILEGVIFLDEDGRRQMTRKDSYEDVIPRVLDFINKTRPSNAALLEEYLKGKGFPLVSPQALKDLDDESKQRLNSYLNKVYDSEFSFTEPSLNG